MLACRLCSPSIRYIYCTDTIVDQNNQDVLDLTQVSLQELGTQPTKVIIPTKVPEKSSRPQTGTA